MKYTTQVQTSDGKLHKNREDAERYLEARLADAMLPLAKKILDTPKYSQLCQLLSESTETFRQIVALQDELRDGIESEEE